MNSRRRRGRPFGSGIELQRSQTAQSQKESVDECIAKAYPWSYSKLDRFSAAAVAIRPEDDDVLGAKDYLGWEVLKGSPQEISSLSLQCLWKENLLST